MVPDKNVVENTVRTSAPKKDRIKTLLGKVVSSMGAKNTFEELLLEHDGIQTLVNKKF